MSWLPTATMPACRQSRPHIGQGRRDDAASAGRLRSALRPAVGAQVGDGGIECRLGGDQRCIQAERLGSQHLGEATSPPRCPPHQEMTCPSRCGRRRRNRRRAAAESAQGEPVCAGLRLSARLEHGYRQGRYGASPGFRAVNAGRVGGRANQIQAVEVSNRSALFSALGGLFRDIGYEILGKQVEAVEERFQARRRAGAGRRCPAGGRRPGRPRNETPWETHGLALSVLEQFR